jgi:uncharacterized membrane protein YesL
MNWSDNIIIRALSRICDFMLLNILWVFCSIPVFTIGASTTALYTVMMKVIKNEDGYIVKGFLKAFKDNFKKSTILWLILIATGIIIGADLRFSMVMQSDLRLIFQCIFLLLAIIWLCTIIYVFPLTARYENTIKNTIKNALLLSAAKLPYTILLLIITAGPVMITLLSPGTLVLGIALWISIGVSLVAWLNSFILHKVFSIFQNKKN